MTATLNPRRCEKTAAVLRTRERLEGAGFTVTDVRPDAVEVRKGRALSFRVPVAFGAGAAVAVDLISDGAVS